METVFLSLAVLACPVGMGLMMWFMGRGMRPKQEQRSTPPSLETPQEEHRRMGAEIEQLQRDGTVSRNRS
jgi:hypothetical protein